MSDPGTTYRNRDEIASMRTARDPIEFVKNLLVDNSLAEAQELKEIEKDIRKEVQVGSVTLCLCSGNVYLSLSHGICYEGETERDAPLPTAYVPHTRSHGCRFSTTR